MSQFEKFAKFIDTDYNQDYWADNASMIAIEMIGEFQPSDWSELSQSWKSQKTGWQARLAESLEAAPPELGFPFVSQLVLSPEDDVAKAAAATIRGYVGQGFPGPLSQDAVARLKSISGKSRVSALTYADLIRKFDKGLPAA